MNKYGRSHGSGNFSKGIYWILFVAALAIGVYKVIQFKRNINKVQDLEMRENKYNTTDTYIILTDSSGKKDTQKMKDYLENYIPAEDTTRHN
jgi:hypothetical protein